MRQTFNIYSFELQTEKDNLDNTFTWTSTTNLLAVGEFDPEITKLIRNLKDSFLTGKDSKPVFGTRELEESDFIFNSEGIQRQQEKEVSIQDKRKDETSRSKTRNNTCDRESSETLGTHMEENDSPLDESSLPFPAMPKGRAITLFMLFRAKDQISKLELFSTILIHDAKQTIFRHSTETRTSYIN